MRVGTTAVLIPTKGRPKALRRLFTACPTLNTPNTYIGIENRDLDAYKRVMGDAWCHVTWVLVKNPKGITSVAREQLRQYVRYGGYARVVLADDNCRFTNADLDALVWAQVGTKGVVSGVPGTAEFFDADQIKKTGRTVNGVRVYDNVGMIFWSIPAYLYWEFTYPIDCYFDDIYFILWCFSRGFTNFTSCLDARFSKKRHEPGGTGAGATRVLKMAQAWKRLATDFPQWMDPASLSIRPPYKRMIAAVQAGQQGLVPTNFPVAERPGLGQNIASPRQGQKARR